MGCICGGESDIDRIRRDYHARLGVAHAQASAARHQKHLHAENELERIKRDARPQRALPPSVVVPVAGETRIWAGCGTGEGWRVGIGGCLLLGTVYDVLDADFLTVNRINQLVNVTEMDLSNDLCNKEIQVYSISIPDDDSAKDELYAALPAAVHHINQAMQTGARVLVFCEFGCSRSASVVAACVMHAGNESDPEKALAWLREKRGVVDPNQGFRNILELWGHQL